MSRQKPVSRQYRWSLRKHAEGKCTICGGALFSAWLCSAHHDANLKRTREANGCKPWKPGGPGRPPLTFVREAVK